MTDQEKCTTIAWMYINRRSINVIKKFFDLTEQLVIDVLVYEEVYGYTTCSYCNKLKPLIDFADSSKGAKNTRCKLCVIVNRKTPVQFSSYYPKLNRYEQIRDDGNGILEAKCHYCGSYFKPIRTEIDNRLNAINGHASSSCAEHRLYCSDNCKKECPVFNKFAKSIILEDMINAGHIKSQELAREVQPELRQMVFSRDNYTCLKCKTHQDNLCVGLHCHHIQGIHWAPLESADIDGCMTVCRSCHVAIHKQPGCSYNDMKCPVEEMEVMQK